MLVFLKTQQIFGAIIHTIGKIRILVTTFFYSPFVVSLIFLIPSQQINTNMSKIKTKRTAFIFLFIPLMLGCRSLKKSFLQKTNVVECPQ